MTGRSDHPSRPPRTRKAKQEAKAAYRSKRAVLIALLRSEALGERAARMGQLSDEFARKVSDAERNLRGPALQAALAALKQEHSAAERALLAALRALYREHLATVAPQPTQRRTLRTRARRRAWQRRKSPRNMPLRPRR